MNLNKTNSERFRICVAIISFAVIWLLHMLYALPGADGNNMSGDAFYAYALDIEKEVVTDWHCALFGHECIVFKRIVSFWGIALNGHECINIAAIVAISISLLSFLYLVLKFCKKWWNSLILFSFYFIIFYFNGVHNEWRHDHLFLYLLFPLAACTIALYCSLGRIRKFCLVVLILLLLWHCVELRKNSIVVVPVVIGAILVCLNKGVKFNIKKYIKKILLYSFCFLGGVFCVGAIIPSIKTYPISPMLISDVRIAHVLKGKTDLFFERNQAVVRNGSSFHSKKKDFIGPYDYDYGIVAYWHRIHGFKDCSVCKLTNNRNVLHCSSPYGMYMENLKIMPLEMCVAKVIQIAQLYRLDYIPVPFEKLIREIYPHAFDDKRVFYPRFFTKRDMLKIWGTFLLMMLTSYYSIKRMKKRGLKNNEFDLFHIFVNCIALVYAASFIVVTPTADYRYLMPSICLGQLVILVWSIHFIKRKLKFVA